MKFAIQQDGVTRQLLPRFFIHGDKRSFVQFIGQLTRGVDGLEGEEGWIEITPPLGKAFRLSEVIGWREGIE